MKSLHKLDQLIDALQSLPSIGRKSATRLAYHLVMHDTLSALKISHAIEAALQALRKCRSCGGLSEDELCDICADELRDRRLLCIVEQAKDILIIEEHALFNGRYYVLENIEELDIEHLKAVISSGIEEVIFAFSPSIANDAVMLYIEDKLSSYALKFSKIAQGVPTGVSLENIDILSLTRALQDRVKM